MAVRRAWCSPNGLHVEPSLGGCQLSNRYKLPAALAAAVARMRELGAASPEAAIQTALAAARVQLGMTVALVSELVGHQRIVRFLDADPAIPTAAIGETVARQDSFCQAIVDGRLAPVIPDMARVEEASRLPVTLSRGVGCHVGVPIRFANGELYGAMCCLAPDPRPELDASALDIISMLASFVSEYLERDLPRARRRSDIRRCTEHALGEGALHSVLQPIVSLDGLFVVGHEALTRFESDQRSPVAWFREAREIGLGDQLEHAAIRSALGRLAELPAGTYLTLNVSPCALLSETTRALLAEYPLRGVVVEITEREPIDDYAAFGDILDGLREAGALIAINDVGAGYASLNQLLELRPDIIKLDMAVTSFVANDPARQAMVAAMVTFARRINAVIVAECVSRANDAETLLNLGVPYAQGNLFGKPSRNFYLYTADAKSR